MLASRRGSRAALRTVAVAVAPPLAVAVIVFGVWELILALKLISPIIVPPPGQVASALVELLGTDLLWAAIGATLSETLLGFLVGVTIGLVIGAAAVSFTPFRELVFPYAVIFQNSPRVALAPIFLIWFGFGIESKVAMSAAICFYPVAINTLVGLASVDRDSTHLLRSLGASRWQQFLHLRLPTAAPLIVAGLKNSMALALIGAIVAEFVSAERGLGVLIERFTFELSPDKAFSALFVLGMLGALLYAAIAVAGDRVLYWLPKSHHKK